MVRNWLSQQRTGENCAVGSPIRDAAERAVVAAMDRGVGMLASEHVE
jgi:hypothetical protein